MLNPLFSAKHLREMTPIFNEIVCRVRAKVSYHPQHCIHIWRVLQLQTAIASRVRDGQQDIDVLGWMGRTALELIGQGGLGHSFDPLTRDVADDFAHSIKAYLYVPLQITAVAATASLNVRSASSPVIQQLEVFGPLLPILLKMGPAWFRRRMVDLVPFAPARRTMAQISDIMHERSTQIYEEKKAALEDGDEALEQQVSEGKDIISVLRALPFSPLESCA